MHHYNHFHYALPKGTFNFCGHVQRHVYLDVRVSDAIHLKRAVSYYV